MVQDLLVLTVRKVGGRSPDRADRGVLDISGY
jgi:hypothetical protein